MHETLESAHLYSVCTYYNLAKKVLAVALGDPRDSARNEVKKMIVCNVAMADPEKHRNEMDVVCRDERKCLVTFDPAPQLYVNSRQLVGSPFRFFPLACRTSASHTEPNCNPEHGSQHTLRLAYRIYSLCIHAPLLNFVNAQSHCFWHVVSIGCNINYWDTEN
jgi:hypothetical protein